MAWVMIDTSSWTHALRRGGDQTVRDRVHHLLDSGTAAWCDMVRLELWNGVRNDAERQGLLRLDGNLLKLPISSEIWEKASELASRARNQGLTVPAADVLIFACAIHYGLGIEHMDRHYDLLAAMPRN